MLVDRTPLDDAWLGIMFPSNCQCRFGGPQSTSVASPEHLVISKHIMDHPEWVKGHVDSKAIAARGLATRTQDHAQSQKVDVGHGRVVVDDVTARR